MKRINNVAAIFGAVGLLLAVCFVLGMLITIAEPDLQVLAKQVSAVMNGTVLIYAVGFGVGAFLVVAVMKIVFKRSLSQILMLFYMLLFALALMLVVSGNEALLPMAFDSGGVTTGPITVPFIMALGVGMASLNSQKGSQENSFGMVALCSVGPVLAVLMLGVFSKSDLAYTVPDYNVSNDIAEAFLTTAIHTCKEVGMALGMIVAFFLACQIFFLKLPKKHLLKIGVGVLFTYFGLVLFLTGVNVGFMPIGYKMGQCLAEEHPLLLCAAAFVLGLVVVLAEPAVHVLKRQVEEITDGTVSKRSMMIALSIGVGVVRERTNVTRAIVVCICVRELLDLNVGAGAGCIVPVSLCVGRESLTVGMHVGFRGRIVAGCEHASDHHEHEKKCDYSFHD